MAAAVERFQADVERLAVEIVRAVLGHELARAAAYAAPVPRPEPQLELQHTRNSKRQPATVRRPKPTAVRRAKPAAVRRPEPAAKPSPAVTAPLSLVVPPPSPASAPTPAQAPEARTDPERPGISRSSDDSLARATATAAPSPAVIPEPSPPSAPGPTGRGRRSPWTRETIVDELANWVSKGTVVDASFLTRHGPPGLVAATKRIFGRFEAAMNVVALQQSKTHAGDPAPR
jgi:hypothetical protein